jgi:hypothetical protein
VTADAVTAAASSSAIAKITDRIYFMMFHSEHACAETLEGGCFR